MMKVTKANFEQEVLNAQTPVLVDFFANWCMPCKMFAPVLDEVAESYANRLKIVKVDIDEAVELAQKYRVMSIPTLAVFKNGELVKQSVGFRPKEQIVAMIEE